MNTSAPKVSVVIPVYNSADIFPELYTRLTKTLAGAAVTYEIIAVCDGCTDESVAVIEDHHNKDRRVKMLVLSRNFGHQAALTTGLQAASGSRALIIDDDLEDPPEVLAQFIDKLDEGYDIVYGIRRTRKVSLLRKAIFHVYYRLNNHLTSIDIPRDAGDFCGLSKRALEHINALPETNRYLRGLRAWVGFKQTGIPYDRHERYTGRSGYSIRQYFSLAADGVLAFSYKPLSYLSLVGAVIFLVSFLMGLRLILMKLFGAGPSDAPGWVSLMVCVLFLGGIQLLGIGVLGQYIARIYDEVKRRPNAIVSQKVGFEEGP